MNYRKKELYKNIAIGSLIGVVLSAFLPANMNPAVLINQLINRS